MRLFLFFLCLPALLCPAGLAQAAEARFLSLSLGYFNALDKDNHEADFRVEYRPAAPVFLKKLKPWAGLEVTSRGALWAGGGFLADFNLSQKWVLTPSLGVGLYTHGSSWTDLDYPFQFRSQLEISYIFQNDSRLGLAFSHMSNASLGDTNTGVETLAFYYSIPF